MRQRGLHSLAQTHRRVVGGTSLPSRDRHIGTQRKACGERSREIAYPESCTFLRIDAQTIFESGNLLRSLHIVSESWVFVDAR